MRPSGSVGRTYYHESESNPSKVEKRFLSDFDWGMGVFSTLFRRKRRVVKASERSADQALSSTPQEETPLTLFGIIFTVMIFIIAPAQKHIFISNNIEDVCFCKVLSVAQQLCPQSG